MNKKFQTTVTIIIAAVIIGHIFWFVKGTMPGDQFLPAILGYFAIWVILMSYDIEEDANPYENINHDVIHKELDNQLSQASEELSKEKKDVKVVEKETI